ncbi:MAG: alanine--glyoxylate aminotransferase family protein [Cellvibrio sp.]|uniref:pyridoxal-phosphate-dependent aminotransferase family protein n=1 Tax=Cellvibrio sp. TaxID=1965322 RepID=UPI002715DABB|nr:alanine--glyoxylate aminotransferase family protein [Cellvibrio sp.]
MENKLMVAGPTEIEQDILEIGMKKQQYNRTPEFADKLGNIQEKLRYLYKTENDVYILSSSGTGAMECAVANFTNTHEKVLVLSGGTFGDRWAEILSAFEVPYELISVPIGTNITVDLLEAKYSPDIGAVLITANETSSGTKIDIKPFGEFLRDKKSILIVDAVSSLGADEIETDKWGCDVVISSSQKALALPPGLALISVSDKAWAVQGKSNHPKYYFDLKKYKLNLSRNQTPFTPPISLLYQLEERLERIFESGIDAVVSAHESRSIYLRNRLAALGISVFDQNPSNGVVGFDLGGLFGAKKMINILREHYHIEVTPSPPPHDDRIIRVGVFGAVGNADIDELVAAIEEVLGPQIGGRKCLDSVTAISA